MIIFIHIKSFYFMKTLLLLCLIGGTWTAYSQYTQIPDPGFEQALIDLGIDSEGVLDGQVLTSDIENVEVLDFGLLRYAGFNNLIGLEDFTSLKTLNLDMISTDATSLDLTVVPTLEYFSFDSGGDAILSTISDIILTNNPNLKSIRADDNRMIQRIDLRGSDQFIDSLEIFLHVTFGPFGQKEENTSLDSRAICIEVTYPEDAENQQGIYENWEIIDCYCFFITDCTLSVSDFEIADFKVYPNPAKEFFQIKTTAEIKRISVYDIQGKEIKTFTGLQGNYSVSDLSSGLYFLKIHLKSGESFIKKLLVE